MVHLHISNIDSKIEHFPGVISLYDKQKGPVSMKIAYISPINCSKYLNFLFATKLSYYMRKYHKNLMSILHLLDHRKGWVWGLWYLMPLSNNISVISCRSVLLVKETGVPGENHRPVASN
jgi:hypothetical protein